MESDSNFCARAVAYLKTKVSNEEPAITLARLDEPVLKRLRNGLLAASRNAPRRCATALADLANDVLPFHLGGAQSSKPYLMKIDSTSHRAEAPAPGHS